MKIFKGQILLFLFIYIHNSSCVLDTIYDTGKEIWKLYLMINTTRSNAPDSFNDFFMNKPLMSQEIMHQMNEIHEQLDQMDALMGSKIIHDSLKSWIHNAILYQSIDTVEIFILTIDDYYEKFRQQINETNDHSDKFRDSMAVIIPNIEENIQLIRRKVIEPNQWLSARGNLFFLMANYPKSSQSNICGSFPVLSKILVQLFTMIIIAEMKVHVIFAITSILRFSGKTGWNYSFDGEEFITQIAIYVNSLSSNLVLADAVYLRACEPINNTWIRDESFYELEDTYRTAIFHYNWQQCIESTCYDVWFKETGKCGEQYYDSRTGCSGTLTDCTHLNTIKACVLESGPQRFHHVNSTEKGLLGSNSECPKDNSYIIEDGDGPNYFHSTCACNCLGNGDKISLSIMQSNVKSNMVITGLRFIRRDGIFYIQPKEGHLDADGNILRYSERWLHIPKNISESQTLTINREDNVFFLDDLRLPSGCVLTGVKFNRVKRKFETGFAIEIFGVSFDYKSGKLDLNRQFSKKASDEESGEPLTFEKISSALVALPLEPSPEDKKYVSLVRSNLHEDFGQSTLPLFDAVPVATSPASPVDGFGIFHKGTDGFAGFISLRIYGIKYAGYFTDFQDMYMKNNKVLFNCTEYSS